MFVDFRTIQLQVAISIRGLHHPVRQATNTNKKQYTEAELRIRNTAQKLRKCRLRLLIPANAQILVPELHDLPPRCDLHPDHPFASPREVLENMMRHFR